MMKYLKDISPKSAQDKVCLLRLDFNTEDEWRVERSLQTIKFLKKHFKAVILLGHKGRPKKFEQSLSLRFMARRLSTQLKTPVHFITHFRFNEIQHTVRSAERGSVFLLENLRFLPGEATNDPALGRKLALLGDCFVNDAFAVSHRSHASVVAITRYIPSYAGFEFEKEIKELSHAMDAPKKPLVVVVGGGKIETKFLTINNLQKNAAIVLVGGALTDEILKKRMPKVLFAHDFKKIGSMIKDIGPESARVFAQHIRTARTIIWNGPVGDTDQGFNAGTAALARSIVKNTKAYSVVGGGETVMFLRQKKLDTKIDFISTGGGAMLDFLAGKELPGIKALAHNHARM
ncbi:MAG: phosphoglycerate kinase [bacterium]|nr:phosphoglycerate kinase [bacterium]